jgi:hypothetical protein
LQAESREEAFRLPEVSVADFSKERGMSLIQHNQPREAMLAKMREKLASTPAPGKEMEKRGRSRRRKQAATWAYRIGLVLLVIGANYLLIGHKETIIARLGLEAVPGLPKPAANLDADQQALYWTYALYDFKKFRSTFGVDGHFAINQIEARRKLEDLLPMVTPATLGEISAYAPVAFKTVKEGR